MDTIPFQLSELLLHKDNQLIAFNKPAGLPTQSDKTGDPSLLQLAQNYVKHPLQLLHRLDRPVSGLVLFAQKPTAARELRRQWEEGVVQKTYLALTARRPEADSGTLIHYLGKSRHGNFSRAFDQDAPHRKKAELRYRILRSTERYHLWEIQPLTGRHHQIRAQLAAINCPVKGDVKYGARRGNRDRSIHLHAWKLSFTHPTSQQKITLQAPPPEKDNLWKAVVGCLLSVVCYLLSVVC